MRLLALGYLGFVVLGLGDGALGIAFPSWRGAFGLGPGGIGWVLAGSATGYFCAGLTAGALGRRIGIGNLIALGMGLVAAGFALQAAAPVLGLLMVGAALFGLGAGSMDAGLNAYVADHHAVRHLNWLHGFYGVGTTVSPLLMTALLLRGESWRWGYALLAAAAISVTILFARTRSRWQVSAQSGIAHSGAWRQATRNRLVRLQVALFFVYTGLEVTLGQWTFSVFTAEGVSAASAGAWTTAYWGAFTAGRFLLGAVIERAGADRLLRWATLGVVAGTLLYAAARPGIGGFGLVLAGASLAPIYPTLIARAPERLGAAIALHAIGFKASAATVGASLLPTLAGVIAGWAGLGAVGWVSVAAALLLLGLHEVLIRWSRVPQFQAA